MRRKDNLNAHKLNISQDEYTWEVFSIVERNKAICELIKLLINKKPSASIKANASEK